MHSMKEKLLCIRQKAAQLLGRCKKSLAAAKPQAERALRFLAKRKIPVTVISCVLVLTMLMSVITVSIHQVDVFVDGEQVDSFYAILTDEESILEKSGLTLLEGDEMSVLEDGGIVTVQIARAFPIRIQADGEENTVLMASGTVADALQKAGLTCGAEDLLNYDPAEALAADMTITLNRVTGEQVVETEEIDFDTKRIETDELYAGQTKVKQKGETGERLNTYQVTYVNGEETERELIESEVTKEPVEKIVLVGTKVKKTFAKNSAAPANYKKVVSMTATAYSAGGTTASGRPAKWGVVAVDPKVIPLGTKVYVETPDGKYIYGTAIAADTGGAIKGYKIDICVNTRSEAYKFGRRTVNVYIY